MCENCAIIVATFLSRIEKIQKSLKWVKELYDSFAILYDEFMKDIDYQAWAQYILNFLQEQFGREKELSILDVACGSGNLTIPFAQAGHHVIGSDISESMLLLAMEKSRVAGQTIQFVRQDMRRIAAHRKQDIINCSCDGVNYLLESKDVQAFFLAAYSLLKPGGWLCFDISSAYKLAKILGQNTFGEAAKKQVYLWQNNYDGSQRLLEMELTFFLKKEEELYQRFFERHIQKAHEIGELGEVLLTAGFQRIEVFEGFTRHIPQEKSERVQFFAQKPNN